jgi:hypothetical protein
MQIEGLAFSVDGLRRDADEIEACGNGNEAAQMRWAADEIERLQERVKDLTRNSVRLPPAVIACPHKMGRSCCGGYCGNT